MEASLLNIRFKFLDLCLYIGLLPAIAASSAFAETSTIKDCLLTFKTKGSPVLISIEGKTTIPCQGSWVVEGNDSKKSKITLDLNALDTGIPLRNKHLRDNYLQISKFPEAVLTDVDAADIANPGKKNTFKANLELHGVKKPIEGTYEVKGNVYSGEFSIDVVDFNVERPTFMGVKVVDKVFLTFKFKAER